MVSQFDDKYVQRGFTGIVVLKGGSFEQSASSHWESTTEFAVGKKDGKYFKITVHETLNFLRHSNDSFDLLPEEISQVEYDRLIREENAN
jgi:hypothetical protein